MIFQPRWILTEGGGGGGKGGDDDGDIAKKYAGATYQLHFREAGEVLQKMPMNTTKKPSRRIPFSIHEKDSHNIFCYQFYQPFQLSPSSFLPFSFSKISQVSAKGEMRELGN